jgi:plastocyanin
MRRLAPAVAASVVALLLAAGPAASQHGADHGGRQADAHLAFNSVSPPHIDVLVGDTVKWTNDSVRTHTVTADDGSFDSGRFGIGGTYMRMFDATGDWAYHCVLHPSIRGDVAVHRLLLSAPAAPAAPNRAYPLMGRAALADGGPVTIEADGGAGFAPVATAMPAADGTFAASVVPTASATYRAVGGGEASPPVSLLVLDRRISLQVRRGRSGVLLRTNVAPASAGGHVVLQLFLHDHFGWWPVQRTRLDRASAARFALRTRRRVAARVLLTLPDGATPLAVSRTVRVGPAT